MSPSDQLKSNTSNARLCLDEETAEPDRAGDCVKEQRENSYIIGNSHGSTSEPSLRFHGVICIF